MDISSKEKEVLSGLKDFQRATVERCFDLYKNGQKRILVADEVGLGKTLIAKGIVAKLANLHKQEGDNLFKVLYICSNGAIANQNVKKLKIHDGVTVDGVSDTRLSMQHLKIFEQEKDEDILKNYIQLIPLTPATSFNITNGCGSVEERALMFAILRRIDCFENNLTQLEVIMADNATSSFVNWAKWYYEDRVANCDALTNGEYLTKILIDINEKLSPEFIDEILECCCKVKINNNIKVSGSHQLIHRLRVIFSQISIKYLQPDLVIMDEFQRFRGLIASSSDSETGMLTNAFLKTSNVKTLLLSATPYKLYQTMEEANENGSDDHYKEFLEVMNFLFDDEIKEQNFKEVWNDFSISLREIQTDNSAIIIAKNKAENSMYEGMCRTERLLVDSFGAFIDDSDTKESIEISDKDIISFIEVESIANELTKKLNVPVDYVKSCPYLLSFMENYQMKVKLKKEQTKISRNAKQYLFVDHKKIRNYEQIPFNNARLEKLKKVAFECKSENLLWVPPCKPYYELGGVFSKCANFSKVLVFSSWEMVPRMIACMLSYEAEKLTIGKLYSKEIDKSKKDYFAKVRYPFRKLVDGRDKPLTQTSSTLAHLYDPIKYMNMPIDQIKAEIKGKIQILIGEISNKYNITTSGSNDADWYFVAPQIFDGEDVEVPKRKMPSDLADVLTNMAIASPAVCGYRIFSDKELASGFAKEIVGIFNSPEAISIIELAYGKSSDDAYYKNVLKYCVDGNFAAVLDEYAHILNEKNKEFMQKQMCESVNINTASYDVDTYSSFSSDSKKASIRSHFAVGFYQTGNSEKVGQRKENLRNAFNSPFRPFVLATTSIGQEGLDFHNYSRKIMHWNLPSNPIDLEQREGRINRYKCLAIRQNIALKYGNGEFIDDIWNELFERAVIGEKGDLPELVPYWCLPDGGKVKIERVVPMYPMSKDKAIYNRLIKILSLYRVTMGQARQEELLEHLFNNYKDKDLQKLFINLNISLRQCN